MDFLIQKAYAAPAITNPSGTAPIGFNRLLQNIIDQIVTPVIYLLLAVAIIYFVLGVMTFIRNADSAEKREEGFKHIMWGIIGIFIMVSAKGIINIILATIGVH